MSKNSDRAKRQNVLGEVVREARIARHYRSQALLAEAAQISERSVAGVEAGEYFGRKVLGAIEVAFDWPERKTTEYLNGNDDALKELPTRGPIVRSAASKQLADIGLTMDVASEPDCVAWLRDLRTKLPNDQFHQVIDLLAPPPAGRNETE